MGKGEIAWIVFCGALLIGGGVGYILNVAKFIDTCCKLDGLLAIRFVGLFMPPLGSVVGYF